MTAARRASVCAQRILAVRSLHSNAQFRPGDEVRGFVDELCTASIEFVCRWSHPVCSGSQGTSLGAAVAIDFYSQHPGAVDSTVLMSPQGFIDGAPPVPAPLARFGIGVLKSWPLR